MSMHSKSRNLALLLHNSSYVVDVSACLNDFKNSKTTASPKNAQKYHPFKKAVQKFKRL